MLFMSCVGSESPAVNVRRSCCIPVCSSQPSSTRRILEQHAVYVTS
ncbi:hypothetical protein L798_06432 [Zootermopsis nevadensis]|uniref:Uncharacterized protein n=1 Tax=Zootermopsis nevadensis TaxID=136037 RepID=A0A067R5X4_ZOONE|nr:hypothetical protein L798_06432 [Zootermopsis nevadensis]